MPGEPLIEVVAISGEVAVFANGETRRFDVMVDDAGELTDDLDEAVVAVVETPSGHWAVVDFSDYESASIQ